MLTGPGAFQIRAELDPSIVAIFIRCNRTMAANTVDDLAETSTEPVCVRMDRLVIPNEGDDFVAPQELPTQLVHRSAFGTTAIDADRLPAGHYFLPTFDFNFVRLTDSTGATFTTYQFDRVSVFRHDGKSRQYVAWYDLRTDLLAVLAGLASFGAYAIVLVATRLIGRRSTHAVAD
jgi:hypothetical protein